MAYLRPMGFYSFITVSPRPLAIEKPVILMDHGRNVFNVVVDDLGALMERFKQEGVEVKQINRLDGLDPVPSEETLMLPGERPEAPQIDREQEADT